MRRLLLLFLVVVGMGTLSRLLVVGGAGSFSPLLEAAELTAAPAGGWIWFTDPRAVTHNGVVYYAYTRGDNGDAVVRAYTEATEADSGEIVLHAALNVDDHAGPSLLVRDSDHKLLAFYSVHDGPTMFMRVSVNSLDTDPTLSGGFATEVDLDASLGGTDYTYPVPIQLTGEANDPIYLFYRDITSAPTQQLVYNKSTDGGATWGSRVLVFEETGRSSYWKIVRNGTVRIDFAVTDGHPLVDDPCSTYHFYYEGGTYQQSDGTSAGTTPLDTADLTLVKSGDPQDTWIHDLAVDASGNPYMVWVRYVAYSTDLRYDWARWTGSAWEDHQVAASGGTIQSGAVLNVYAGGIALDQADPTTIYASTDTGTVIRRYETTDGGTSFDAAVVASAGSGKQIRPVCPVNAEAIRVLWMNGTYTNYTSYSVGTSAAR